MNPNLYLVATAVIAVAAAAALAPPHSENPGMEKFSRGIIGRTEAKDYDVHGRTAGDVARSMQALGPEANERFGHTRATYGSAWHTRNDGTGRCELTAVQVTMVSQTSRLRWTPPADTVAGVYDEWQRFTTAVQKHEVEHTNISSRGARQLLDGLLTLKTFCSEVPRDVKILTDSITAQTQRRQAAYDLLTHEGGTQGAVFLARVP